MATRDTQAAADELACGSAGEVESRSGGEAPKSLPLCTSSSTLSLSLLGTLSCAYSPTHHALCLRGTYHLARPRLGEDPQQLCSCRNPPPLTSHPSSRTSPGSSLNISGLIRIWHVESLEGILEKKWNISLEAELGKRSSCWYGITLLPFLAMQLAPATPREWSKFTLLSMS